MAILKLMLVAIAVSIPIAIVRISVYQLQYLCNNNIHSKNSIYNIDKIYSNAVDIATATVIDIIIAIDILFP